MDTSKSEDIPKPNERIPVVAGGLGIEEELVDNVFPMLYPHKEAWNRMKELVTNGDNNEELSLLLNEHNEERIMMPGEAFSIRD